MMGAIASMFGQGMSGMAEAFNLKDFGETLVNGAMALLGKDVKWRDDKDEYGNQWYHTSDGQVGYHLGGGNYENFGSDHEARQNEEFWNLIERRLGLETNNQRWNGRKH